MSRCMGGWCAQRERCLHYRPGEPGGVVIERLCEAGTVECFQAKVIAWVR